MVNNANQTTRRTTVNQANRKDTSGPNKGNNILDNSEQKA